LNHRVTQAQAGTRSRSRPAGAPPRRPRPGPAGPQPGSAGAGPPTFRRELPVPPTRIFANFQCRPPPRAGGQRAGGGYRPGSSESSLYDNLKTHSESAAAAASDKLPSSVRRCLCGGRILVTGHYPAAAARADNSGPGKPRIIISAGARRLKFRSPSRYHWQSS
jgi:hypothetical protein